jgi:uncharacterized protein (DUF2147 family)
LFVFHFIFSALMMMEQTAVPVGLWQQKDEGFVIRVEACGTGLCGYAAGMPANAKKKEGAVCGAPMLKEFRWNAGKKRWEGQMKPPDLDKSISSSITSDGTTFLTMRGQMLFLTKTMSFVPYRGKIGADCRLE